MGLFFNAKNNKEKWASVVMPSSNAKEIPTATLEAATALFIQQHARILAESIRLFLTSMVARRMACRINSDWLIS